MANGSVYDKIINKGKLEAEEIIAQGTQKANNITDQVMQETDKKINLLLDEARIKNEDLIKTRLAEAEQNKKQNVLANKKQIIKDVFNEALNRLLMLNDEDLKELVINYLKKANIKGNEIIRVNQKDYNKYQKLFSSKQNNNLDLLNKMLNIDKGKLTLDEQFANIKGGFIIISDYFDIDNSFETILETLEGDLETTIASKLFGSEE